MERTLQAGVRREVQRGSVAWKEPMYDGRSARRSNTVQREVRRSSGNNQKSISKKKKRKIKKMQYKILRGILIYFILAGIAATCFMIFNILTAGKVHAQELMGDGGAAVENALRGLFSLDGESGDDVLGEPEGSLYGEEMANAIAGVTPQIRQECQELFAGNRELLVLVNKENELAAFYEAGLRSICEGRLQAADILYEDLCAMLRDAGEDGFQYWIASAYRDRGYQQGLVDEDVEKYLAKGYTYETALEKTYEYTMPAGHSEHETGLALDILCSTNTMMDESQAYESGNQWLVAHCHEYGFILRYPSDKEEITGIKYEPWHFRYVGRETAALLKEMGWTLEEFYDVVNGAI